MKIRIKYKKGSGIMKKVFVGMLILSLICCIGCSTTKKNKDNEEKRIKLVWLVLCQDLVQVKMRFSSS